MKNTSIASISVTIGATGMLKKASNWIASKSDCVYVVSRGLTTYPYSQKEIAVTLDYKAPTFLEEITEKLHGFSRLKYILLWVHSDQHPMVVQLLENFSQSNKDIEGIVQVFGTSSSKNALTPKQFADKARSLNLTYNFVQLGSIKSNSLSSSRWLTHNEISDGSISAIISKKDIYVGS